MNNKVKLLLAVLILCVTIIPLLVLTFFAHPATDDFGFAFSLMQNSIWKNTLVIFKTMDNRLVGNFLTLLFCNTGNLFVFRLQFFIFIILFFSSIFFLFRTVNKFYLNYKKQDVWIVFSVFAFLFVGYNPGIVECFYWYPGIIIWILGIVLFNVFLSLVIYEIKSKNNLLRFIAIVLLAFTMASENEILFIFMGIFGLFLLYDLFKSKSQNRVKIIIMLFVLALGAVIVIFGPGNYYRLKFISTQQPATYFEVIKSDVLLFRKLFFLNNIIFLNIILMPFYFKMTEKSENYIKPAKLLLLSAGILFILLLPSFIAKLLYSWRIQNVVYYFSLCLIFINFINLSIWLRASNKIKINKLGFLTVLFAGFFFVSFFLQKESALRTIYADLLTGKAVKFDKEMTERYNFIKNTHAENVKVPSLINTPKSIYGDDITQDSLDWRNQVYSHYFNKKNIILDK